MAIEWSEESQYKKIMRRWDRPKTEFIVNDKGEREYGYNRAGFEKYPQMLYKMQFNPISKRHEVAMREDVISLDKTVVLLSAEQFNASCQLIVRNDDEYDRARRDGWRDSHREAIEYHDGTESEKAVAAAVRNYEDRNMSEKAQREAAKYEAENPKHNPVIPEQPRQKRKYTRKAKAEAAV